jgi:hypothetical protein
MADATEGMKNPRATESTDTLLRLIAACRGKRVVVFGD